MAPWPSRTFLGSISFSRYHAHADFGGAPKPAREGACAPQNAPFDDGFRFIAIGVGPFHARSATAPASHRRSVSGRAALQTGEKEEEFRLFSRSRFQVSSERF